MTLAEEAEKVTDCRSLSVTAKAFLDAQAVFQSEIDGWIEEG